MTYAIPHAWGLDVSPGDTFLFKNGLLQHTNIIELISPPIMKYMIETV